MWKQVVVVEWGETGTSASSYVLFYSHVHYADPRITHSVTLLVH